MDRSHEDLKLSLAAYALDALPADDELEVARHIETCDECRLELEEFQEVERWMRDHLEQALPAGFEDRLLRKVAPPTVVATRRRWLVPSLAAALAATLAVAGLSVWRGAASRDELTAARTALEAVATGEVIFLSGSGGQARLAYDGKEGVLVAAELPPLAEDRVYQLWLQQGQKPISAGTFEGSNDVTLFRTTLPVEEFDTVIVTLEPEEGSPEPNLDQVVLESA